MTWTHILELFVLAIPIACVARTVVFEEVFREAHDYCVQKTQSCANPLARKFFYLFTCEYCFSHYVTGFFLGITGFHLLFADWRGLLIAFFSLVFVANLYLNLYSRLRVDISSQKKEIEAKEKQIEKLETELCDPPGARGPNSDMTRNRPEDGWQKDPRGARRDRAAKEERGTKENA